MVAVSLQLAVNVKSVADVASGSSRACLFRNELPLRGMFPVRIRYRLVARCKAAGSSKDCVGFALFWINSPHNWLVIFYFSNRKLALISCERLGYGQNGEKPKRLQVQRKRINLLSSTMDPFSVLLTKFGLIQVCSFCYAVISL